MHDDAAVAGAQRRLERFAQARRAIRVIRANPQPVLNDFKLLRGLAVHARVTLALELGANLPHRALQPTCRHGPAQAVAVTSPSVSRARFAPS